MTQRGEGIESIQADLAEFEEHPDALDDGCVGPAFQCRGGGADDAIDFFGGAEGNFGDRAAPGRIEDLTEPVTGTGDPAAVVQETAGA